MTIAIDFDGTIKRSSQFDPKEADMWFDVVDSFAAAGHLPIIVTMRHGTETDALEISPYNSYLHCSVYYCGDFPGKRTAMRHHGITVDVWIDDMPDTIGALPLVNI